jgi:hypothetical protein
MKGVHHYAQHFFHWDGFNKLFCSGWPLTVILPISTSWVARITGVSCLCLAKKIILKNMFHVLNWLQRRWTIDTESLDCSPILNYWVCLILCSRIARNEMYWGLTGRSMTWETTRQVDPYTLIQEKEAYILSQMKVSIAHPECSWRFSKTINISNVK